MVHVVAMKPFHESETRTSDDIATRRITLTQNNNDEDIELPNNVPKRKPGRPRKENNPEVPQERQVVS